MGDGRRTARYTAYSLAYELGWSDVDAMLEALDVNKYREWLEFFKIKNEKTAQYGTGHDEQRRMGGDLLRAMTGYQKRREKLKRA